MGAPEKSIWTQKWEEACAGVRKAWQVMLKRGPSQFQFWLIALIIGIAAGFAALLFRKGINALQALVYGTADTEHIHSVIAGLPWYWVLIVPDAGRAGCGADPALVHAGWPVRGRWPM